MTSKSVAELIVSDSSSLTAHCSRLLHFLDRSMVFLKALYSSLTGLSSRDALDGVESGGESGDVRGLVLDAFGVRTAVRSYKNSLQSASIFVRRSPCVLLMAALRMAHGHSPNAWLSHARKQVFCRGIRLGHLSSATASRRAHGVLMMRFTCLFRMTSRTFGRPSAILFTTSHLTPAFS